ncbi:RIP metalloprotease RseP [bacterium]|nr:RIP metalloprotease RseP [bacterium]
MNFIFALLALCVLIFVHELGHFLLAKLFSVQVLEFAIGFGPRVSSFRYGETEYSLRIIPLGGYVRMAGDNLADFSEDEEELSPAVEVPEEEKVALSPRVTPDRERWFLTQPFFPKFCIVLAGPAFNVLFAVLFAWFAFALYGDTHFLESSEIGGVMTGLPADEAGLQSGDIVESVNGEPTESWEALSEAIRSSSGEPILLRILREGESLSVEVSPTQEQTELEVLLEDDAKRFKVGILPAVERKPVSFFTAGELAVSKVYWTSKLTVLGLFKTVVGEVSTKNLAGPLFIMQQGAEAAGSGFDRLIDFMVFLSVSLALLNLLPIPVLDGGHLLFFIIEAVRGQPTSVKVQERATAVGMIALLLLMVFALSNDVMRFLG